MTWGRPVTDADGDRYRDLFADLTPDEVRVITGLVRAMRENPTPRDPTATFSPRDGEAATKLRNAAAGTAWHIAHAISQMGES